MFNITQAGKNIAKLRKQANLTQFALADKLGISFQAVSNWERGVSMPDIAKLPELAEFFGVPIDAILGEKSPLVESAAEGKLPEYLAENPVSAEELEETAAMLPPAEVETLLENAGELSENISACLPFVSAAFADATAERLWLAGTPIDDLADFISPEKMAEMANLGWEKGLDIRGILPYLEGGDLRKWTMTVFERDGFPAVEDCLGYLDDKGLMELAVLAGKKGWEIPDGLLYCLSDEAKETFVATEFERKGAAGVAPYLPYLSGQSMEKWAFLVFEEQGFSGVEDCLNFLDDEALTKLAVIAGKKGWEIPDGLLYCLSDEAKETFVATEFERKGAAGVAPYLPYLSGQSMEKWVPVVFAEQGLSGIEDSIACMEEDMLRKIWALALEKGQDMEELMEFLPEHLLKEYAFAEFKEKGFAGVKPYLPFMAEKDVEELLRIER